MNVDLEAVCKTYLIFLDSEFCDGLDSEAECKEKEQKAKLLFMNEDMPDEEAEELAKVYRVGILEGFLIVADEWKRLISIELGNEVREFQKSCGYLCPNCDNTIMLPESDYIPVLDGYFNRVYICPKCGFSREFPKAILVRDIFTEYVNKEKEVEE